MLYVPKFAAQGIQNNLAATPSRTSSGTIVTASGSTNTKGSYSALISSTSYDTFGVCLVWGNTFTAATRTDMLLDLATGGAGSEQVIFPNLLAGWADIISECPKSLFLPLFIPKGTRVAARCQSVIASDTVDVQIHCLQGPANVFGPLYVGCDAYGVTSSAASNGTSVTAGNSGSEGSWTNIGSTTSRNYKAVLPMVQGGLSDTVINNAAYHFEVGYSSTNFGEFWCCTRTNESTSGPFPNWPLPMEIPSGTQLQIRGECSGTAEPLDVALYCFY